MIKKLILVLLASILFITGCQKINNLDLSQMILNSSKVKSSESKMTVSLGLTYNRAYVQDKNELKVLDLLNHAKLEIQTKMQDSKTISLTGNIILQQGKIPFKLYMDSKEMVILLDNANKPIRIPTTDGTSQDDKLVQDIQTKLLVPIVNNLPNPKHISVNSVTERIQDESIDGYNVHAEVYASESDAPSLILSFIDNLVKDDSAVSQIVDAVNELNKATGDNSTLTAADFKAGLEDFKLELTQILPDLKTLNILTTKNYFKTDILVDRVDLLVRKSSSVLNIQGLPSEFGITGIHLQIENENWNINKPVTAQKIAYSKYLNENLTPEQFLATLDKKHSVLYSVVSPFILKPSPALKSTQLHISNNKKKADLIIVNGIKKGDIIKIYNASGKLIASKQASGSTVVISTSQLGIKSGKIYVSIIRSNMLESARIPVAFKGEPSAALKSSQVHVSNNKKKADLITVKGLAKGDIIKVYKTGGKLMTLKRASGSAVVISASQLGIKSGKIYVSIIRSNMLESARIPVAFKGEPSAALKSSQVHVSNYKRKADLITVKGLAKGDIIKVYKTGGKLMTSKRASGSTVSISVSQLGKKSGKIYVSITRSNMSESTRMAVAFKRER